MKNLSSQLNASERADGYSALVALTALEHAILIQLLRKATSSDFDLGYTGLVTPTAIATAESMKKALLQVSYEHN